MSAQRRLATKYLSFGDLPYVGRFFRSEGTRNQKKNLIITVKATQVDDRGMTRSDRIIEREREAL